MAEMRDKSDKKKLLKKNACIYWRSEISNLRNYGIFLIAKQKLYISFFFLM